MIGNKNLTRWNTGSTESHFEMYFETCFPRWQCRGVCLHSFSKQGSWISKIVGHLREFELSYVLVMKTVNNIKGFEVIIIHTSK